MQIKDEVEKARLAIAKYRECFLPCACNRNPQHEDCQTLAVIALTASKRCLDPEVCAEPFNVEDNVPYCDTCGFFRANEVRKDRVEV